MDVGYEVYIKMRAFMRRICLLSFEHLSFSVVERAW